jgi:hypothetical protein
MRAASVGVVEMYRSGASASLMKMRMRRETVQPALCTSK